MNEGNENARACSDWAAQIEACVREGIELGLPDDFLTLAVQRVLELEQHAAEQHAAAKAALEARNALAAAPIRTPRHAEFKPLGAAATPRAGKPGSNGKVGRFTPREQADASTCHHVLREGSLVQLQGLEGVMGLSYHGYYDASLGEYNGRKGRVSRDPPAWVIKAAPAESDLLKQQPTGGNGAKTGGALPPALIPVLLDSRSSDKDRGHGVWVAVPPENLKVL